MATVEEVLELIDSLEEDKSIPKNVRAILEDIKALLRDNTRELGLRIDSAVHLIDGISLDPNLSSHTRTQVWNLTSLLEEVTE